MTRTLLTFAIATVAFGSAVAQAQAAGTHKRSAYRSPPGLEAQERATTRALNNEQADGQPAPYYGQPYSYAPQYSYVPPPAPAYSYRSPPAYAYPYDYPPRPWNSRYY